MPYSCDYRHHHLVHELILFVTNRSCRLRWLYRFYWFRLYSCVAAVVDTLNAQSV